METLSSPTTLEIIAFKQSLPLYPALHVQIPVPDFPSLHWPRPLHGVAAPPGHAEQEAPKYPGRHSSQVGPVNGLEHTQSPKLLHVPRLLQVDDAMQYLHVGGLYEEEFSHWLQHAVAVPIPHDVSCGLRAAVLDEGRHQQLFGLPGSGSVPPKDALVQGKLPLAAVLMGTPTLELSETNKAWPEHVHEPH